MKRTRMATTLVVGLAVIAMMVPAGVGLAGPRDMACGPGLKAASETSPTPSVLTSPTVRFTPRTIKAKARGRWIEAKLRMPLGMNAADIDTSTVMIADISGVEATLTPVKMRVSADTTVAPSFLCMKFSRKALVALLDGGKNTITLTWTMKDGSQFSASDTVRVIGKKHHGSRHAGSQISGQPRSGGRHKGRGGRRS